MPQTPDSVSLHSNDSAGAGRGAKPQSLQKSIFGKAPSFTRETFASKDFIARDFIQSLTENALNPTNRKSGNNQQPINPAFDPKPLIRSFEQARSQLEVLSDSLKEHESELLTAVRKAEIQHSQTLDHLGKKLDESIASFQQLDQSLNPKPRLHGQSKADQEGGLIAVKIGAKIAQLDKQRKRALDSSFLVQCWIEASEHGDLTSLENLRRNGGGDGMVKCAVFAGQLMTMSKSLDPLSWESYGDSLEANTNGTSRAITNGTKRGKQITGDEVSPPTIPYNTRALIEKFSETLEQDLLKSFDTFYRTQNFDAMRECAAVLFDFNGGSSVIAQFVNQHQLFIDRDQVIGEEVTGEGEVWEKVVNPDADPPGVTPKFQALIDEVKTVAKEESAIVRRAFPYYELVMGRFLARVFQQSIQERLADVLRKAEGVSSIAFLRCLQACRSYVMLLVDDLKNHGLTEHPEPMSAATAQVLESQFDDLFVPYLVGSSYMERERRSLEELYSSLLFKYTVYHSSRKRKGAAASGGSSMLGNWVASARDAYLERLHGSDLTASQKTMLLRVAGLKNTESADAAANAKTSSQQQPDIEVTEQDGILSVTTAKRMLRWFAEAIGRRLELGSSIDVPKDMATLLDFLLSNMGDLYIETALAGAIDQAVAQEALAQKASPLPTAAPPATAAGGTTQLQAAFEPDLSHLTQLRAATTITHLLLSTVQSILIPLATPSLPMKREMEKQTSLITGRIEDLVNTTLQRTVDLILTWVSRLLGGQRKTDFRGVAGEEALATPTCLAVCAFLTRSHGLLQSALGGGGSADDPALTGSQSREISSVAAGANSSIAGPNLRATTTEIILGTRQLLLSHFKRYPVSAAGGLMVTKDLSRYVSTLTGSGWEVGDGGIKQSLEVLTEVGTMFIIGPEALRERLRDKTTGTGGLAREEWRGYLVKRDDAGGLGMLMVLQSL